MEIDREIVAILQGRPLNARALTINDFARRFGANPAVIRSIASQLVESNLASACMLDVNGVQTLHALLPK